MAESVIKGKVWKFDDNISTDLIMPSSARGDTPQEIAAFCLSNHTVISTPNLNIDACRPYGTVGAVSLQIKHGLKGEIGNISKRT